MAFWIFMFVMDLLIPLTMIGFGKGFIKHPPSEINGFFGYRTSMSMKNKETWQFAHHYCGKVWVILGWIGFAMCVVILPMVLGKDKDCIGMVGGIVCAIQCVFLIVSILPTEVALKKKFDKDGKLR